MSTISRTILRKKMLAERARLHGVERILAERRLLANLKRLVFLHRGQQIACYMPIRNEVNLLHIVSQIPEITILLPKTSVAKQSITGFGKLHAATKLIVNPLAIPEPDSPLIHLREISLVLLPMVGFNRDRYRLGYGGGYYDRFFSRWKDCKRWHLTKLVGVAYSNQETQNLTPEAWDVPLDAIVTDREIL